MKKTFIALLAIASMAACNKADVIGSPEGEVIAFANPFVDNATKAADKTYSGDKALTAFNLYGTVTGSTGTINIYNDCEVTGTVGSTTVDGNTTPNIWTCPVDQYWIKDAKYNFVAIADGTVVDKDVNGLPLTITCNTAVDANNVQNDLLYARPAEITGRATGNSLVNFTFDHLLAKAQFTVKSTTEGDYYYSVKNIYINNYVNGTYTIASATWAGTGTKANTAFGDVVDVRKANTDGKTCDYQRLLIPNTENLTVTFTVELWNANGTDDTTDDVKLSTKDETITVTEKLLAGNAYNFNISLSVGELIQFTVTQNPAWTPTTGGANVTL